MLYFGIRDFSHLKRSLKTKTNPLLRIGYIENSDDRSFVDPNYFKMTDKAKEKIWKSMLKGIKSKDANLLSESYDFSGAQIENITRKHLIKKVISGKKLCIDDIKKLCGVELIERKPKSSKIGFK